MYVFSVMLRETAEAGYCRAAVWDVEDEIDTVDREMLEPGVLGR